MGDMVEGPAHGRAQLTKTTTPRRDDRRVGNATVDSLAGCGAVANIRARELVGHSRACTGRLGNYLIWNAAHILVFTFK